MPAESAKAMRNVMGQVRNALVWSRDGLASEKDGDLIRWRVE